MNRLYTITDGATEMKGLIAPGELPNLMSNFEWLSRYYGAEPEYQDGSMIARKEDVEVRLTVGGYHKSIPGKRVLNALVFIMDERFSA